MSLLAGILATGCMAGHKAAASPEAVSMTAEPGADDAADPRDRIQRLWAEIESMQAPSPSDADSPMDPGGAMEPAPESAADGEAGEPLDWRRGDLEGSANRGGGAEELTCPAAGMSRDGSATTARCGDSCRIGGAICDNAEAICRIAGELAGDSWAEDKCADAREACEDAKTRCCDCIAGE